MSRVIHSIIIDSRDNVATLCEAGRRGDSVRLNGSEIKLLQDCAPGNKVALIPVNSGEKIIKYNAVMGTCTQAIQPGEWVHSHNLVSNYMKSGSTGDNFHE
jgi:hypothetical protein